MACVISGVAVGDALGVAEGVAVGVAVGGIVGVVGGVTVAEGVAVGVGVGMGGQGASVSCPSNLATREGPGMDVQVGQTTLQLRNLRRRDGKTIRIGPGRSRRKTTQGNNDRRIHSRTTRSMDVGHGRGRSQAGKIHVYRDHCLRLV